MRFPPRYPHFFLFFFIFLFVVSYKGHTEPPSKTFVGCPSGNWNDPKSWNPEGIPSENDHVLVGTSNNGSVCTVKIGPNVVANYHALSLGNGKPGNVVIEKGGKLIGKALSYLGADPDSGLNTVTVQQGAVWEANGIFIGDNAGSTGQVDVNGGTITDKDTIYVGQKSQGIMNMNGGTITCKDLSIGVNNPKFGGTMHVKEGTITINNELTVGRDAPGTLTMDGGIITSKELNLGSSEPGNVTVNKGTLNGGNLHIKKLGNLQINEGTLTAHEIIATRGAIFEVNGGTLQILGNNPNFIKNLNTLKLGSSGATVNVEGHQVTINANITGDGGLTFTGKGGSVVLSGSNSYTGKTNIKPGVTVTGNIPSLKSR